MRKSNNIRSIPRIIVLGGFFALAISLCSCFGLLGECDHSYTEKFRSYVDFHTPVCDRCGIEGEPLEHRFGELIVTTPATKQQDGEGYYPCLDCGYHKRETIIGCEHSYVFVEESEPTCYSFGMRSHYKCEGCDRLFDDSYNEVTRNSLLKTRSSHSYDLSLPEIKSPTSSESGYVKYFCENYEHCRESVRVSLPKLSENGCYTKNVTEEGNIVCNIKESYLNDNIDSKVGTYTRGQIVDRVLAMSFEYSNCDENGHIFVKDGFVNEDGKLFYVCQKNNNHRYEISLPDLDSGEYTVKTVGANCTRGAGKEYRLGYTAWRSILSDHIDEVCAGDTSRLSEYADALFSGFAIFSVENGELDPDVHPNSSLVIRSFVAPTFDVYTYEYTTGTVKAICADCGRHVETSVEYSEGKWEVSGGYLSRKYTRTYTVFDQKVSDAAISNFKYRINTDGGSPVNDSVELTGTSGEGYIVISPNSYTYDGREVYGVRLSVDGKVLLDYQNELRIEECEGWSLAHGTYTYWKVYVGGEEYPGHILITLLWRYPVD